MTTGMLEVFGAGQLDVLSVGSGHLRVEIAEGDEAAIERARQMIEEMMQRGFAIFVEQPDGTTSRVRKFNPKKMVYIIDEPGAKAKRKKPTKEVPVDKAKATAVGRTAGG